MKLSTAILEGSKLRPQCFNGYHERVGFDTERGEHLWSSCTLAAAAEAIQPLCAPDPSGFDDRAERIDDTLSQFAILDQPAVCPVCAVRWANNLFQVISHLNDTHLWTRERIADWVEQFETVSA